MMTNRGLPEELIEDARRKWPELHLASEPLDLLPLLELYRERRRASLEDTSVLFIQHQLAPLSARLRAMQDDGLSPDRTWLVDIPYSTNNGVHEKILENFTMTDQIAKRFVDPFTCYQEAQEARTLEILRRIAARSDRGPLLIVDDGAYVMKILARPDISPELRECFRGTRVIEQTTRGHRFLESAEGHRLVQDLGIIAVSVARSSTKVRFEAPYIGEAVAQSMRAALTNRGVQPRRALVIGYGSVGAASVKALRDTFSDIQFDAIDADTNRLAAARADGCRAARALPGSLPASELYDVVLGCTGGTSFTWENRVLLDKDAVLASGSSAAVELDRQRLIDIAEDRSESSFTLLTDRDENKDQLHTDIRFGHGDDKIFTILNAGFPVNFDGNAEHIPTVLIQPTHVLLYAAVCQVMELTTPGFRLLDPAEDYWIFENAFDNLIGALDVNYYLRTGRPVEPG